MIRNYTEYIDKEPRFTNELRNLDLNNLDINETWEEEFTTNTVIFTMDTEYNGRRYRVSNRVSRLVLDGDYAVDQLRQKMRHELDTAIFGRDRYYVLGYQHGLDNIMSHVVPSSCEAAYQAGLADGQGDRINNEGW